MTDEKPDFWFHAKNYGWGWGLPASWQGWTIFVAYVGLILGNRYVVTTPQYRLPYIAIITVLLIVVVALKGERPLRWRRGKK
jgi:lipoprotein signal peptidase